MWDSDPGQTALVLSTINHKLWTHPLIREVLQIEKTANVMIISKEEKEKLVAGPRLRPDTRTDWLTDCQS
jgi:hypothetical protein